MSIDYQNPLLARYASAEMSRIFGPQHTIELWRRLWIVLAEAERELGLPITKAQIQQMKAVQHNIDFDASRALEKVLRHDVMAHVHAFGQQAPDAAPIIHLGATSCYVTDNADIIKLHSALCLIRAKLVTVIAKLRDFALKHHDLPTLGYTHLQSAQLTTVGKRAALWIHDLLMDFDELNQTVTSLKLRGVKGTTGTQASFLALFDGDSAKVKQLENLVVKKLGFEHAYPVSSQTYSRKVDYRVLSVLSSIAQSAYKFADDLRLLQGFKEMEEPFETDQIGSSAMAYKRNPMRSERICSLARYAINLVANAADTAATQWLERTLDDSANRRIVLPQAFLTLDAVLNLYINVADGLVVFDRVIASRINAELPFMATEQILMEGVLAGGDRQVLHEAIREHSMQSALRVKRDGQPNDLVERLMADKRFAMLKDKLHTMLDPANFIGCASTQTLEFLRDFVDPIIVKNADQIVPTTQLEV